MNFAFARALLKIHLAVLDLTDGATARPNQIDIDIAEDGITAVLTGHIGDDAVACAFDPEGIDLADYRAALDRPSRRLPRS